MTEIGKYIPPKWQFSLLYETWIKAFIPPRKLFRLPPFSKTLACTVHMYDVLRIGDATLGQHRGVCGWWCW